MITKKENRRMEKTELKRRSDDEFREIVAGSEGFETLFVVFGDRPEIVAEHLALLNSARRKENESA